MAKPDLTDQEIQEILNFEMPSEALDYNTVFTIRTNKERPDGKGKVDVYEWENLPPLGNDTIEQTLF